jgi:hypothetical protein
MVLSIVYDVSKEQEASDDRELKYVKRSLKLGRKPPTRIR